ncbi:MAG: tetratricopeptide repeat protein [Cyanobacteria bacterium P01_C01_bin.121]
MTYHLRAQYIVVEHDKEPTQALEASSADEFRRRGSARRGQGRFDDAIADYDEALRIEPDNLDLHRLKALTLHLKGDMVGASQAYKVAAHLLRARGCHQRADDIQTMLKRGLQPLPKQGRN